MIYVVFSVARQVEGEYTFIRTEGAFQKKEKADALLKKLKTQFAGPDGRVKLVKVTTPNGEADCFVEVAAHEVELQ